MDYSDISPKFIADLKIKLGREIWNQYKSYRNVRLYILSGVVEGGWNEPDNFQLYYYDDAHQRVDVEETLLHMPPYEVVKMAIDLGIETPGFLPAIPKFKNILKDNNQTAYQNFERAIKNVHDNPDEAVSLACSTLEGIIKTILNDESFATKASIIGNKSLTKLVSSLVVELGFDDKTKCPPELITISSQLRGLGKSIDDLRSDKSTAHGKAHNEYVVDDPLWAGFIVNASASLGLFLWEYYEKKYRPLFSKDKDKASLTIENTGDQPVNLDDIPF